MLFISINLFLLLSSNLLHKYYVLTIRVSRDNLVSSFYPWIKLVSISMPRSFCVCMFHFSWVLIHLFSHMYFQAICVFTFKVYLSQ